MRPRPKAAATAGGTWACARAWAALTNSWLARSSSKTTRQHSAVRPEGRTPAGAPEVGRQAGRQAHRGLRLKLEQGGVNFSVRLGRPALRVEAQQGWPPRAGRVGRPRGRSWRPTRPTARPSIQGKSPARPAGRRWAAGQRAGQPRGPKPSPQPGWPGQGGEPNGRHGTRRRGRATQVRRKSNMRGTRRQRAQARETSSMASNASPKASRSCPFARGLQNKDLAGQALGQIHGIKSPQGRKAAGVAPETRAG